VFAGFEIYTRSFACSVVTEITSRLNKFFELYLSSLEGVIMANLGFLGLYAGVFNGCASVLR